MKLCAYVGYGVLSMRKFIPVYIVVVLCFGVVVALLNCTATVFNESLPIKHATSIIIDAGHGGEDGGATSCTGVLESKTNLEIALKLEDLMHLLGMQTKMIRKTDCSVATSGNTISSRKISDLKERIRIINETNNALLISIHQNTYPESVCHGAQVFYNKNEESKLLASKLQTAFVSTVNIGSNRKSKQAVGIYLMDHIDCTSVLIECGFISNPEETTLLNSEAYQKKLCIIIAASISDFLNP